MDFIIRLVLCFIFPPLAVFDKGCGSMLIVMLLTCFGWIPGTAIALLICLSNEAISKVLSAVLKFSLESHSGAFSVVTSAGSHTQTTGNDLLKEPFQIQLAKDF